MKAIHKGIAEKKQLWTYDEVKSLKNRVKTAESYTLIGIDLGRSRHSVASKARRLGVKRKTIQ